MEIYLGIKQSEPASEPRDSAVSGQARLKVIEWLYRDMLSFNISPF